MKIFKEIPDNRNLFRNPALTVGNFDGVHCGHLKILETLVRRAEAIGGEPVVVTFKEHPRKVLNPELPLEILTTTEEKVNLIFEAGVRNIIVIDFTRDIASMTAWEFYNDILIMRLDIKELVIGYDHAFGKNREGNFDYLLKMASKTGIGVTRVSGELNGDEPVSSTRVKKLINSGEVEAAVELLGRPYCLTGNIVHGAARGRIMGFPTANIEPDSIDKVIPRGGVYAVNAVVGTETFKGIMNIGSNPTFETGGLNLEVHLLNFDGDIYDEKIMVDFLYRLRDEKKFSGPEELVRQIQADREKAAVLFGIN